MSKTIQTEEYINLIEDYEYVYKLLLESEKENYTYEDFTKYFEDTEGIEIKEFINSLVLDSIIMRQKYRKYNIYSDEELNKMNYIFGSKLTDICEKTHLLWGVTI